MLPYNEHFYNDESEKKRMEVVVKLLLADYLRPPKK